MDSEQYIAIQPCSSYEKSTVLKAVLTVWDTIGIPDLKGKKVLIKPNILSDKPAGKAVTTHPAVVEAVCKIILDRGGHPCIGDSPAIQGAGFLPKNCGIQEICERLEIPWVDFTEQTTTASHKSATFTVTKIIDEVDYIVNLPKMKTHQFMYFTGAVKNLFGLLPSLSKSPYHLRYSSKRAFARMILDLYQAIPVEIHIMDAVIAMEGPGPGNGTPKRVGAIIASKDGIALDTAVVTLMGEIPKEIPILKAAFESQMITSLDPKTFHYPLATPDEIRPDSYKTIKRSRDTSIFSVLTTQIRTWFTPKSTEVPVIEDLRCIRCSKCVQICPADAMSLTDSVVIDYSKCIRCYCCHEVCPVDAITINPLDHNQ